MRKRTEFLELQRLGRRRAGARFVVISVPRTGRSRLGITVSRRVGDAVVRNRIKRLVREFFRHHCDRLTPPQDIIVIARATAAGTTHAEVTQELRKILKIDVAR